MSQPKKKSSRSRRDIRRFGSHRRDHGVAVTTGINGTPVRTHRVTLETLSDYVAARTEKKKDKK